MSATRLRQGLALARDWIAPGEALAQWTHFVTSVCNARCAHCFYPINAGKNELTLAEIGEVIGVCESRVCQLRSLALSRLRTALRTSLGIPEKRQ